MISAEQIDTIKERIDLLALITPDVDKLQKRGPNWWACCPFHPEKTPSFQISPGHGTYHCFGCGASGDAFTYVMERDGGDFPDVVRSFAAQAGIQLEAVYDPDEDNRRRLLQLLRDAAQFYAAQLDTPAAFTAARELAQRGFTREDAAAHGCGYAPAGGAVLVDHMRRAGYNIAELRAAGLVGASHTGDFFRDRLMWPIHDTSGKVRGFTGRKLPGSQARAKYLNSPETDLFHKATLMQRLHRARSIAPKTGLLIVVEGSTDVMAVEKLGHAAVASCGTAFGTSHVDLLDKITKGSDVRVVFAFDGDNAGREATVKAWKAAGRIIDRCEAILWPDALDPCDLLRHGRGADAIAAIAARRPLTHVVVDYTIDKHLAGDDTPEARSRAIRAVDQLLDDCPDLFIAAQYRVIARRRLGMSEQLPTPEPEHDWLPEPPPDELPPDPAVASRDGDSAAPGDVHVPAADRSLLAGCLQNPDWLDLSWWRLTPDLLCPAARELYTVACADPAAWAQRTPAVPDHLTGLWGQIAATTSRIDDSEMKAIAQIIRRRATRRNA